MRKQAPAAAQPDWPRCARCGALIKPGQEVWREYDRRRDLYLPEGQVPAADSQGGFTLGKTCAKRDERKAAEVRNA